METKIKKIKDTVLRHMNLKPENIVRANGRRYSNRLEKHVIARQLIVYFICKTFPLMSLNDVSDASGFFYSHDSILYIKKKVDGALNYNSIEKGIYENVKFELNFFKGKRHLKIEALKSEISKCKNAKIIFLMINELTNLKI